MNQSNLKVAAVFFWTLCISAHRAGAVTPSTQPAGPQPAERMRVLQAEVAQLDETLSRKADEVEALQQRAEALFLMGRVDDAVRDFDRVVKLAPDAAPYNWQRGIALYYVGRFDDAAKQFEQHRKVNPDDVENAAWHFLCVARALGVKAGPAAARAQLIPIKGDTRIPLMKIHELYAGTVTPADVLKAANAGGPGEEELGRRLFYAHLYIGLYYEAAGDGENARKEMDSAAAKPEQNGYMGEVARLHAWRMAQTPPTTQKAER